MSPDADDQLDRAAAAALALAAERPWRDVTLHDIALKATVPLTELFARAPGKRQVVDWLSARFDLAALKATADDATVHDQLFDAMMRRIEVMEPHRALLLAVHDGEGAGPLTLRLPRTARAILEGAGVDASGRRGVLRLAAITFVWARVLQVWRADDGALNRTMAEIDRRLKLACRRLKRFGAGW